jgi:lysozyme family protein
LLLALYHQLEIDMTASTYDAAMVRVFADEGGYTNHPKDPGGPTNWGITLADARMYWKADATPEDVKAMPKAVAALIYREHYAKPIRYDDLPAGFDYSALDAAINSGRARALQWASKALGITSTEIVLIVRSAASVNDKVALIQRYWQMRLSFLHSLRTWSTFGGGWGRRCAQGEAAAVRMWLSVGAELPAPEARKRLDQEANRAKTSAAKAATAGAGSAAGSAAPAHLSVDLSHLGSGGKVATAILVAVLIGAAIYFIRKFIIHNQRAAAYAAS